MTISKTWWNWSFFEPSQLQKPLFSFFLSFFHILPLSDLTHIYFVKFAFSLLGIVALYIFIKSAIEISQKQITHNKLILIALLFCLFSPIFLKNFSRIRSDQVGFLFFILSVYFYLIRRMRLSFLFAILLPISSIKSILFFIPLAFIILPQYLSYFKKLNFIKKLNLTLLTLAALVWAIGYNLSALSYLIATYQDASFPTVYLKNFVTVEMPFILLSILTSLWILLNKRLRLIPYALASLSSLALIVAIPQSYSYYIASFVPIVYLPLLTVLIQYGFQYKKVFVTTLSLCLLYSSIMMWKKNLPYFISSCPQILFISKASALTNLHGFNYLDGMGMLPRQNLIPCFASPSDPIANNGCREALENQPDVIIITQRLLELGNESFKVAAENYFQVYPNYWVHQKYKEEVEIKKGDLDNLPVPLIIFMVD
ncbi:hypothetical protein [Pseudobdellovibrio exovorus]|nr:hypothetical protein [Pseudobdellovibrio exovorus]